LSGPSSRARRFQRVLLAVAAALLFLWLSFLFWMAFLR
jgi:hypothetical protein